MNPNNPVHRERLRKARDWSWGVMKHARVAQRRLVQRYAGDSFTIDTEGTRKRPVNKSWQAASAMVTALVPPEIRYHITPRRQDSRSTAFAASYKLHLNNLAKQIYLSEVIATCVLDSWFKVGVAYVHMADDIALELEADVWTDPGRPAVTAISIHDFVQDMSVKRLGQRLFYGHGYEVSWERLRDLPGIDKAVVDKIQPKDGSFAYHGDTAQEIGVGSIDQANRVEDVIRLQNIYLPRERLVCTFTDKMDSPPLRVVPAKYRDCGPYPQLSYDAVPDNLLPVAPAEMIEALDDSVNSSWRKASAQAKRERTIPFYTSAGKQDMERILETPDGKSAHIKDKNSVGFFNVPGVSPMTLQYAMAAEAKAEELIGNPSAMMGASQGAETASEAELVSGRLSAAMQRRAGRVRGFTASVGHLLGDQLWEDGTIREAWEPLKSNPNVKAPDYWFPNERHGSRDDYDVEVAPYSMPHMTPSQRAAKLRDTVRNEFIPMMPFAAEAGRRLNFDYYVSTMAELEGMPEFEGMWDMAEPQQMGAAQDQHAPASTTRTQVRVNRGGAAGGQEQKLQALQMAGMQQQQQMATIQ